MKHVRDDGLNFLERVRQEVFSESCDAVGAINFKPVLKMVAEQNYSGRLVIESEQVRETGLDGEISNG